MPQSLIIDLHISADEFLRHYQGAAKQVACQARDGRSVRFPTNILQRFVRHDGIHGTFRIDIDENNKLIDVQQLV
ncbi:MAG: DUF2835 domain-containing protein [Saccharospirillum sp.]|jgi:hypothetical protein